MPEARKRLLRSVLLVLVGCALWIRGPLVLTLPDPIPDVAVSEDRLRQTVQYLSVDLGPRWYTDVENLDRASRWIEGMLRETGLEVSTQEYRLREGLYRNVIARRSGTDPAAGVVIVGAHYDAYGKMPGADDNASGVAALLELCRTLPAGPGRRAPPGCPRAC